MRQKKPGAFDNDPIDLNAKRSAVDKSGVSTPMDRRLEPL
jgi:hypothetical protein